MSDILAGLSTDTDESRSPRVRRPAPLSPLAGRKSPVAVVAPIKKRKKVDLYVSVYLHSNTKLHVDLSIYSN